jgi:hypothetical protein
MEKFIKGKGLPYGQLRALEILEQNWEPSQGYLESLEKYLVSKNMVFEGDICTEYPLMSSFASKQEYLEWYAKHVGSCIGRLYETIEISKIAYKRLGKMLKNAYNLLGEPTFLPIVEERVVLDDVILVGEGELIRPWIILPDNRRYKLLQYDTKEIQS